MSLPTKRIVIHSLFLALLIWPLCHIALVSAIDLNPWKGGGWAMYCVPELKISFSLESQRGSTQPTPRQSEMVSREVERFSLRYRALGGWVRPNALARTIFKVNPDARTIRVQVAQRGVDRKTARIIVLRHDEFNYARP